MVLPTDTVYGLACAAHLPDACERALRIKGRDLTKPTSVIAASLDTVFATVLPELLGRAGVRARRLLPVPGDRRRAEPRTTVPLAVRARPLADRPARAGAAAVDRRGDRSDRCHRRNVGEPPGEPDPASLAEVPEAILSKVAVAIDGGPTPIGSLPRSSI